MYRRILRAFLAVGIVGQVLIILVGTAWGDTIVAGKSAQALRCAAYIGMSARIGYDEGYLSEGDADTMTWWSVRVLEKWVPLPIPERLAAYRITLGELGPRERTYDLIARHSDWCIHAFSPSP